MDAHQREAFKVHRWAWLLALLAAVAVFANSLHGDFILDDRFMIEDNPRVHSWQYVPDYFTEGVWHNSGFSDFSEIHGVYYRPLHLLLLRITHAAFGSNTFGYHVVNLLLFLANIVLVYFLVRKLLERAGQRDDLAAAAATLIFAVHPTHTESVAWIAGATDPLAFLFALAALLFYMAHVERNQRNTFIASVVCFSLGLLAKETVIVLPVLFVAYNVLFKHPVFPARLWTFIAVALIYFVVRSYTLGGSVAINPQLSGFWSLIEFVAAYVKLLLVPWPLNYYFYAQPGTAASIPEIIVWWAITLAASICIARYWRQEPLVAFGAIWIVVTLAPTLVWAFNEFPVFAVRYLYPPTIGLSLIAARGIQYSRIRWPAITAGLVIAIVFSYGSLTVVKNRDWQNEERFFISALAVPTHFDEVYAAPLALLGKHYFERNMPDAAIRYFAEAEKIGGLQTRVFCNENIGLIYGERGDYARSTEYYLRAYRLKPNKSSVLVGLGNNAYATKDLQQALRYYTLAYEADVKNRSASYNLSLVYAALGDIAKANYYRQIAASITEEFVH